MAMAMRRSVPQLPGPAPLPAPRTSLPEDTKRINPTVLLITLLDDLNLAMSANNQLTARMGDLLARMEGKMEAVPQGVVEVFDFLTVTLAEQVMDTIEQTEHLWSSATIYNLGPDDVKVRAGELPERDAHLKMSWQSRYVTLSNGESIAIDFHAPLLRFIYYKGADDFTSGQIRIVGEW